MSPKCFTLLVGVNGSMQKDSGGTKNSLAPNFEFEQSKEGPDTCQLVSGRFPVG